LVNISVASRLVAVANFLTACYWERKYSKRKLTILRED
jgi:hypothetical protein